MILKLIYCRGVGGLWVSGATCDRQSLRGHQLQFSFFFYLFWGISTFKISEAVLKSLIFYYYTSYPSSFNYFCDR
jgi:hypothetical protein